MNLDPAQLVEENCMADTSPEIAELVRQRLMARSSEERFLMGIRIFDASRDMALASLPAGLSPEESKRQLFQRLYGQALPA
jgi:hypothetical protein